MNVRNRMVRRAERRRRIIRCSVAVAVACIGAAVVLTAVRHANPMPTITFGVLGAGLGIIYLRSPGGGA
jgi:peptidoglycan/LPS O-acetylase OafA/YrhL